MRIYSSLHEQMMSQSSNFKVDVDFDRVELASGQRGSGSGPPNWGAGSQPWR